MGGFSLWHILILALVLLLVFGGNRFSSMMSDVAKGIKNFKQGMTEDDEAQPRREEPRSIRNERPIDIKPEPRPAEPATPPSSDDQTSR